MRTRGAADGNRTSEGSDRIAPSAPIDATEGYSMLPWPRIPQKWNNSVQIPDTDARKMQMIYAKLEDGPESIWTAKGDSGSNMIEITANSITPLKDTASPFCMDDQWFTRTELYSKGMLRRTANAQLAIRELKRALLSANALVINRSYFVNTDAFRELLNHPSDREGLMGLLSKGAISAFLLDDKGPEFEEAAARNTLNRQRLQAWNQVTRNAKIHCIRLDWREAENKAAVHSIFEQQFAKRLHKFADNGASVLAALGRRPAPLPIYEHFLRTKFRPTLDRLMEEHGRISRSALYRALIVVDGSDLSETIIDDRDQEKRFPREVKQAIDLIYNTNLTDAIGARPLIASDSAGRDVLSESGDIALQLSPGDAADLIEGLSRAVGAQRLVDAHIDLLAHLSMQEILEIRSSGIWREHLDAAEAAAATPANPSGRALVDEVEEKVAQAQAKAQLLAKDIIARYGKAWKESRQPLAATYRLSARIGTTLFVDQPISAATSGIGMIAGAAIDNGGLGGVVGGSSIGKAIGTMLDGAIDGPKKRIAAKFGQQIDLAVSKGVSMFTAARLPRFQLGEGTVDEVVRLLKERGAREGAASEVSPATEGHASSRMAPDYG